MTATKDIVSALDEWLDIHGIEDSSANGLQVEGPSEVCRIALATDAAMAVYRRAAELRCGFLLVHHGLIWGGLDAISGRIYEHVRFLIENEMALYAAHLPLDVHPELGNNTRLASLAGLTDTRPFWEHRGAATGVAGFLPEPLTIEALAVTFQDRIGGSPELLPFGREKIRSVGIVSGGGGKAIEEAIRLGLDCFVTGEPTHSHHHLALEAGINAIYLGHYHSETAGVRAVGERLEERFGVETVFIDMPTLV
ncbi:MAG: Nif3-like dinuclear metal center hexameric protein [Deltaproteobacteria bacterium]|nr:Nif3-like dinuclear metal center hexameric protein [Deltaproteobacteria bacterium]